MPRASVILYPAAEVKRAGDCLEHHLGVFHRAPSFWRNSQQNGFHHPLALCLAAEKQSSRRNSVSPAVWWVPVGEGLRKRVWCFSFRRRKGGGAGERRRGSEGRGGEGGGVWLKVSLSDALCFKIRHHSPKKREFVLGAHTPFPAAPNPTLQYPILPELSLQVFGPG